MFLIYVCGIEIVGIFKEVNVFGDVILFLLGFGNVVGIDFDVKEWMIYFFDIVWDNISRISFVDRKVKVLVKLVKNVDGLVVDWFGWNLYWIDVDSYEVMVVKLNGLFKKVLFDKDVVWFRVIVLYLFEG